MLTTLNNSNETQVIKMDPNSSRSPLDEGEIFDDDSKEFDDGYDEHLLGDEEDKRKLALMTEKEREQELFNRSERRETLKTRFEIERKLRSKAKKRELDRSKPSKQARSKKRLRASEIYSSDSSSEVSEEYEPDVRDLNLASDHGSKPTKMTTRAALNRSTSSSESESESEFESEEASSDGVSDSSESGHDNFESEAEEANQADEEVHEMTLIDLKAIQLKRTQIRDMMYMRYFKETATGCFVKISIGNHPTIPGMHMYRAGQITEVVEGTYIYDIQDGKRTNLCCVIRIGRNTRTYRMSFISNRSFDEEDLREWRLLIEKESLSMPTQSFLNKKKNELKKATNYEMKDEDVSYQVKQNMRFNPQNNLAVEKSKLRFQKTTAEDNGDYELAANIQKEIDEIEEKAKKLERSRSSSTFSAISFVNERNRQRNIAESEKALLQTKTVKTEDPFTRRKCTPMIVHHRNNNGEVLNGLPASDKLDKSSQDKIDSVDGSNNSIQGVKKTLIKAEPPKAVDDLFQAHASIRLDIELDLDI